LTTANFTGFQGISTEFRVITIDDVETLKVGILKKTDAHQPKEEKKKKR
jgi:hypothetical protein